MRFSTAMISCVAVAAVSSAVLAEDNCVAASDNTYTYTDSLPAPSGTYAYLMIKNNFASSTTYFGSHVTDKQIWLYYFKNDSTGTAYYHKTCNNGDPGGCTNTTPPALTQWKDGVYVNLSRVWNGTIYLPSNSNNQGSKIMAVISQNCPSAAPDGIPKVLGCSAPTDGNLAYALYEWNFYTDYENNDISFIDQFSFPARLTMSEAGSITYQGGFASLSNTDNVHVPSTADNILEAMTTGAVTGLTPPNWIPYKYPNPQQPYIVGPQFCAGNWPSGLPQNYFTGCSDTYYLLSRVPVETGISGINNAYRVIGPSKAQIPAGVPAVDVFQDYTPYLKYLYGCPDNNAGFYIDYSGNNGFSFRLQVYETTLCNKKTYGLRLFNFVLDRNKVPCMPSYGITDLNGGSVEHRVDIGTYDAYPGLLFPGAQASDPWPPVYGNEVYPPSASHPTSQPQSSNHLGPGYIDLTQCTNAAGQRYACDVCTSLNTPVSTCNQYWKGVAYAGELKVAADGTLSSVGNTPTIGNWTSALIASGAATFNPTTSIPCGTNAGKYPVYLGNTQGPVYPGPVYLVLDDPANDPNSTGNSGPNHQMKGIANYTSAASSCNEDGHCYQEILNSMISRTSVALSLGMLYDGWNEQHYPQPDGQECYYNNSFVSGGSSAVPIMTGFTYLASMLTTDPNSPSGNGCPRYLASGCVPQAPCKPIGVFSKRPTGEPYWYNQTRGDAFCVALGKFAATGPVQGTSPQVYASYPYFTTYTDNFTGAGLKADPPVKPNARIQWELGVPTTNPPPPNNCCTLSTDINGDGDTSGPDLTLLLGGFGTNQSHLDLDDSGIVDGGDLAKFLAAWEQGDSPTPCPDRKFPSWATVVTACPDPNTVTSKTLRDNIVNSGWAWQVRDIKTGILMVWIPLDTTIPTFTMGCSPASDQTAGCPPIEYPTHSVTLTSEVYNGEAGFYMSVGEVTQAEWMYQTSLPNPSLFPGSDLPVERVSYSLVKTWLQNASTGSSAATPMRLPTEAEWEYAYRAGTVGMAYHGYPGDSTENGSNDPSTLMHIAWYASNSAGITHAINEGNLQPNGFGLYNMSGNVWEWVNDYDGSYSKDAQTNPQGPEFGSDRVLRGGSYDDGSVNCRASSRIGGSPSGYSSYTGFRVARNAESPSP